MKKIFNRYEYWDNEAGEWNWHFKARNNEIQFGSLQGYTSESDCIRGIKAAKRNSVFSIIRRKKT